MSNRPMLRLSIKYHPLKKCTIMMKMAANQAVKNTKDFHWTLLDALSNLIMTPKPKRIEFIFTEQDATFYGHQFVLQLTSR